MTATQTSIVPDEFKPTRATRKDKGKARGQKASPVVTELVERVAALPLAELAAFAERVRREHAQVATFLGNTLPRSGELIKTDT